MLRRKQMANSGDSSFKNSKVNKRKRRRTRSRNTKSYLPSTSQRSGSLNTSDINPSREDKLLFNDSPLKPDLHERNGNQVLPDCSQFSEDDEWTRTVRRIERDSFGLASNCCSSKNIECWSSRAENDNRDELRSTDSWRKLLFPEEDVGLLLISEEMFKEHVKVLLDGIDLALSKPSLWSRLDTNYFFNKIQSFTENWSRQLLKEKEKLDEEVWLAKERLKIKYDQITNRLSLLTGVLGESVATMNFSVAQKQAVQSQMEELHNMQWKLIGCDGGSLASQEVSFANQLKEKDRELEESRKHTDKCREELKQTQNNLKATQEELNNLINTYKQKTEREQKEMLDKLSEIRSMLVKKSDSEIQNGRYCNGDLNMENKQILNDIKSLIEAEKQLKEDENVKETTVNIQKTAEISSILQVTENEMHLVILIASFLKVTPFPVSTEFIYLYVAKIDNIVDLQYVERLLEKFPTFFKGEAIASGSTEKNWSYLDLKPIITI